MFRREEANPILTAADWPYTVNAVFNPGTTLGADGETILLVRVEDRAGFSHLTVARSVDGIADWKIDSQPLVHAGADGYQDWGAEDPRITEIDGLYYLAYTGFSPSGPLVVLARTADFLTYERCAVVSTPEDKDAALFPVLFGGRYALFRRPVASSAHGAAPDMWISFSPDLTHWGDHRVVIRSRRSGHWDREKVGLGPPPLETAAGWLILFHGVRHTAAGSLYRAGLALLHRDDPTVVMGRSDEWVFGPEAPYELQGDVPGVVFPTGWLPLPDGRVRMYYGAADTCVAAATAVVDELVDFVETHCVCGRLHPGEPCPIGGADPARSLQPGPMPK